MVSSAKISSSLKKSAYIVFLKDILNIANTHINAHDSYKFTYLLQVYVGTSKV